MKKVVACFLCILMSIGLLGCKEQESPHLQLQKGVTMTLLDALRVTNETNNTVYYYFLADIENKSKSDFLTDSVIYEITDEFNQKIHPIDSLQRMITKSIAPDQSSFVYGYVGYPNNNQDNMGLLFPKEKKFLPFSSVKVREIDDKNVKYSHSDQFTLFSDSSFAFHVDSKDLEYSFENGNSMVKGLKITYENKTDRHLVVPYITPQASMLGIDLEDFPDKGDFSKMNTADIKKVDFSKDGMSARTSKVEGISTGYECFYLPAKQKVECDIVFIFEHVVPDFKSDNSKSIVIDLNSSSFGYTQSIHVKY